MAIKLKERRLFPRLRFVKPLRYSIRGRPEFNNSICDNISATGLGFINNKFLAPDTPLMLEFNILSRSLNPIGRVVWSANIARSDKYRLGVEFLELAQNEKRYLSDYINMKLGKL